MLPKRQPTAPAAAPPGQPPTPISPHQAARRPRPCQPPRGQPSLSFPALPTRRGATFIRRCALLRSSFPTLAALRSLRSLQRRPVPLPTAPIPPGHQPQKQLPNASPPHRSPAAWGQKKAPRHDPAPPAAAAGRGPKSPPPASKVCVPATQAEARPASRRFHWGAPQAPAIMPRLTPGHPPRLPQPPVGRPLPPHKAGSAEYPLGASARPPKPQGKASRVFGLVPGRGGVSPPGASSIQGQQFHRPAQTPGGP
jgi:hypothetical protein